MIDLIGYKIPGVEGFVIETTTDKGIKCISNFLTKRKNNEIIRKK